MPIEKSLQRVRPRQRRFAGVPRALRARHELDELAVAANEEMRGYSERRYAGVIRMRGRIEAIQEQLLDAVPAELARRQADRVDDEELDRHARAAARRSWASARNGTPRAMPVGIDRRSRRSAVSFSRRARP